MKKGFILLTAGIFLFFWSCQEQAGDMTASSSPMPEGKLFIIGGGKRPPEMVQEMMDLAGLDSMGYVVVLPMSSSEPDTAFF